MFWRRILVMPSSIQFLNGLLCTLGSENQTPNFEKSLKYISKIVFFCLPGYLNIRSHPHVIFTSTWLNIAPFWIPKPTKIASWARLGASWARFGASWGVLGASWSVLGSSWSVLERLGCVLERLGRVFKRPERIMLRAVPGSDLRRTPGGDPFSRGRKIK